jgi:malonyl-CoA O-methyltransferase
MSEYRPDKKKVAQSFSAAAEHYDDVAVLQRQTADELLDRLSYITIEPQTILDLGAGTGRNLALLQKRYPHAQLVAVDIAPQMLKQAEKRYRHDQGIKRWLPNQPRLQVLPFHWPITASTLFMPIWHYSGVTLNVVSVKSFGC